MKNLFSRMYFGLKRVFWNFCGGFFLSSLIFFAVSSHLDAKYLDSVARITADAELIITSQRENYDMEMYELIAEVNEERHKTELILSSQEALIRRCSILIQNLLLKVDELEGRKPRQPTRSDA